MRRHAITMTTLVGLLAAGSPGRAATVKYVYGPGGRLDGQFENGVAIGYTYDLGGNITRRYTCQGACFVEGQCWDDAEVNPANVCQACTPGADDVAWTARVGLACDDGNPATLNDACNADGVCAGVMPPEPPPEGGDGGGCCGVAGGAGRSSPTGGMALVLLLATWRLGRRRRGRGA
jgi:hypothetical protein